MKITEHQCKTNNYISIQSVPPQCHFLPSKTILPGGDPAEDHQGPGPPAGREGGQEDREGQ